MGAKHSNAVGAIATPHIGPIATPTVGKITTPTVGPIATPTAGIVSNSTVVATPSVGKITTPHSHASHHADKTAKPHYLLVNLNSIEDTAHAGAAIAVNTATGLQELLSAPELARASVGIDGIALQELDKP